MKAFIYNSLWVIFLIHLVLVFYRLISLQAFVVAAAVCFLVVVITVPHRPPPSPPPPPTPRALKDMPNIPLMRSPLDRDTD